MRNVEKRGVNFRGSIYSVKEGSIRTEYPKWNANNVKINHNLDELGKALKNFTVKSK